MMALESRSHQQMNQLETKISHSINEVVQTQLEKLVVAEMKNTILPR